LQFAEHNGKLLQLVPVVPLKLSKECLRRS